MVAAAAAVILQRKSLLLLPCLFRSIDNWFVRLTWCFILVAGNMTTIVISG